MMNKSCDGVQAVELLRRGLVGNDWVRLVYGELDHDRLEDNILAFLRTELDSMQRDMFHFLGSSHRSSIRRMGHGQPQDFHNGAWLVDAEAVGNVGDKVCYSTGDNFVG